jgi:hypothetical protein
LICLVKKAKLEAIQLCVASAVVESCRIPKYILKATLVEEVQLEEGGRTGIDVQACRTK